MSQYSKATYKKRVLQIRKWLRFLNLNYLDNMKMPSEPSYFPIYISIEDINHALQYFNNHSYEKQGKALIMLGAYTGLRSSEIYRLKLKNIDFDSQSIYVEQTKDGKARIVFLMK